MTTISFNIILENQKDAAKALKAALPNMKNAAAAIASGSFKIPNDKAKLAADALKPYATQITIEVTDDSVDKEVAAAEERLTNSLAGLEARLNAKTGKLTAKLMNIAADLLDNI